jgi:hypothetical protein
MAGSANDIKTFHQGIKDLRQVLENGGLAWAHATESAGKYLRTIVSCILGPDTKSSVFILSDSSRRFAIFV